MYATNRSGTWLPQVLDSSGNMGTYSALTLNAAGGVYVAYKDDSGENLKIATNLSGGFQTYVIDSAGNVGQWIDAAFDETNGVLWVSYIDNTNGDVKSAKITVLNAVDQNCDGY